VQRLQEGIGFAAFYAAYGASEFSGYGLLRLARTIDDL
jgi:hypothetical protein